MIALKKILVPTDFSKGSENALRYGCELAAKYSAELHLLHVMQETIGDFDAFYAISANFFEEMREDALRRMDATLDSAWNAGKGVTRVVKSGTPFLEILR
ncbi:MAG: universal stress protein, partial [Planctomycetaceae bacterium]